MALDDPGSEWALLLGANLKSVSWMEFKQIRKNKYTSDLLLLGKPKSFLKMSYTASLWKAWSPLRDFLALAPLGGWIPDRWAIDDTVRVIPGLISSSPGDLSLVAQLLGSIGFRKVGDLWSAIAGSWLDCAANLRRCRNLNGEIPALTYLNFPFIPSLFDSGPSSGGFCGCRLEMGTQNRLFETLQPPESEDVCTPSAWEAGFLAA